MFQITWKDYLIFLGGALAVYYLYIALAYYRKEIIALLRGSGSPGSPQPPPTIDPAEKKRIWQVQEVPVGTDSHRVRPDDQPPNGQVAPPSDRPFSTYVFDDEPLPAEVFGNETYQGEPGEVPEMEALQNVVAFIRDLFAATDPQNADKDGLLESIGAELTAYPSLTAQPYKLAIGNLISTEAKERFDLTINERDLASIWPQTG